MYLALSRQVAILRRSRSKALVFGSLRENLRYDGLRGIITHGVGCAESAWRVCYDA